jgi:hypothetical protein
MNRRSPASISLACLCALAPASRPSPTDGVKTIAAPGLPGEVSVWGEDAIVLATAPTGRERRAVAAMARFGRGKVIAFAHDGFFSAESMAKGDTRRLFEQVLAADPATSAPYKVFATGDSSSAFAKRLLKNPQIVETVQRATVVIAVASDIEVADAPAITKFVADGGTLLIAQCGWGWEQLNPGKSIATDLGGNVALRPMGLAFTANSTGSDRSGIIEVHEAELTAANALTALRSLATLDKKLRPTAAGVIVTASELAPGDSTYGRELAAGLAKVSPESVAATPAHPLTSAQTFERVALGMQLHDAMAAAPDACKPFPTADAFPGPVPADAPRVTREVPVDLSVPRWHSTGLYAAPGQLVTVSLPAGIPKGLRVRIGGWTDSIAALDKWPRPPAITKDWPLDTATTQIANPFGGPIYIEVSRTARQRVAITIAGAVEAPMYTLGETTPEEWTKISAYPAPWAELIAPGKVILTVPSESVRTLEDPKALMEHWTKVLDAMADFGSIPRERKSAERLTLDTEISAGYMHSGYPIMTHMDVAKSIVDLDALHSRDKAWGFYHELGHNHQQPEWTFDGTVEVTNNVFDIYVLETVCGLTPDEAALRATGPRALIGVRKYLAAPDFEKWKRDPFLALAMYVQLRQGFGWKPFKRVFAEYRDLPRDQRPHTELEKHDQWMERMSRATGRNLGPFFDMWAVPVSAEAKARVANFPEWKPAIPPPKSGN